MKQTFRPLFLAVFSLLAFEPVCTHAATDAWTYKPPASGTRGSISWTDSSGFENVINGIVRENDQIIIYPNQNRNSTTLKNADFSIPVRDEGGNALAYSPDFLAGKKATGSAVLGYITGLTNIVVNANATSLGNYCFKGCTGLVRVRLNDGLESIQLEAFRGDTALVTVENFFPDSLKTIGNNAFQSCTKLLGPVVGNGLETIGSRAFHSCPALQEFDFGASSIAVFPEYVFFNCTKLGSAVLPLLTTSIGEGCFEGCSSLTNVTPLLPPRLATLGSDSHPAFINDPIQGHVVSPPTLARIGTRAFRSSNIETFTGPKKGLKSIGQYAFYQNYNLTNVVLSADLESLSDRWMDSSGTTGVEQHVWFRNLPSTLPSNLWTNTKKQNITIHLPWSQRDAWIEWVASGPSGHTFTFGGTTKTLPTRKEDVGTWQSGVMQYVTWWVDINEPTIFLLR